MIKTRSEQFKNLIEILIITLLVIIAFFWTTKSYASGTPFYNAASVTVAGETRRIDGNPGGTAFIYNQSYTPSSTVNLCTIVLPTKKTGNPDNLVLLLRQGFTNSATADEVTSTSMVFWDMASSSITTSNATYNLNINPCITLQANTEYNIVTFQKNNGGSSTSTYDFWDDSTGNVTTNNGTIGKLYQNQFGYNELVGKRQQIRIYSLAQLAASIDFSFPTNGTTTGEFSNWNVLASGEVGTIKINYSGNFSSFQDTYAANVSVANTAGFSVIKRNSLGSTSTIWFATAYLYDSVGTLTAQSSQIIFTFNPAITPANTFHTVQDYLQSIYSGTATLTLPYNDASSSLATCNPFNLGTCFVNAGKAIGHFLFTPSQNTSDQLKNSLISFSSVFPFSVPMTIIQEINNQASTTPASGTLSLTIPDLNNMTLNILTPTTTQSVVGVTAKDAYFNAARTLMYLATGAHMFFVIF